MNDEVIELATKYIALEWARKMIEHDLAKVQKAGLKHPTLFEQAAVRVLDQISLQMRDVKQEMRQKGIKIHYVGKQTKHYDAVVYDVYAGGRHERYEMSTGVLRGHVFECLETIAHK